MFPSSASKLVSPLPVFSLQFLCSVRSCLKNLLQQLITPLLKHLPCLPITCQIKATAMSFHRLGDSAHSQLLHYALFSQNERIFYSFSIPHDFLSLPFPSFPSFLLLLLFFPCRMSLQSPLVKSSKFSKNQGKCPPSSINSILMLPNRNACPLSKPQTHQLYFSTSITTGDGVTMFIYFRKGYGYS